MNATLEGFEKRTAAQMEFALTNIAWWNEQIARGVVTPEHAAGYLKIERDIVAVKQRIMGAS